LASFAKDNTPIDLAKWLTFYAFNTIGALTFDKPIGFMEKSIDVADILETVHPYSRYGAVMGVFRE